MSRKLTIPGEKDTEYLHNISGKCSASTLRITFTLKQEGNVATLITFYT